MDGSPRYDKLLLIPESEVHRIRFLVDNGVPAASLLEPAHWECLDALSTLTDDPRHVTMRMPAELVRSDIVHKEIKVCALGHSSHVCRLLGIEHSVST